MSYLQYEDDDLRCENDELRCEKDELESELDDLREKLKKCHGELEDAQRETKRLKVTMNTAEALNKKLEEELKYKQIEAGLIKASTLSTRTHYDKWKLLTIHPNDDEYAFIRHIFFESQRPHRNSLGSNIWGKIANVTICRIEKLLNHRLQDIYQAQRNNLLGKYSEAPPLDNKDNNLKKIFNDRLNEVFAWHGTTNINIDLILKEGFDLREDSSSGKRFGFGNYFATSASKADDYTDNRQSRTGRHTLRKIILARIILGKPSITERTLVEIHKPPDRCDSVIAWAGKPYDNTEIIVYNNSQALPTFVLTYKHNDGCECAICKQRPD